MVNAVYNEALLEILEKSEDLPCLPSTAMKIFQACSKEKANIEEIAALIKSDQAIVAKILRTVNSALFNLRQDITSIREAINLLGVQGIKNTVIVASSSDVFNYPGGRALWLDSIEASVIIEGLFEYFRRELDDSQFLTALLHNIGRAIFAKNFNDEYHPLTEIRNLEEIYQAEEKMFGMNHKESGGILATNWELPLEVVSSIQGNHASMSTDNLVDLALELTYTDIEDIKTNPALMQFVKLKNAAAQKIEDLQL